MMTRLTRWDNKEECYLIKDNSINIYDVVNHLGELEDAIETRKLIKIPMPERGYTFLAAQKEDPSDVQ